MKRWIVCILALLVALSGCAAREVSPSVQTETISDAAPEALPEAMEEPAEEPEAPADELPESCRVYYDTAARCAKARQVRRRGSWKRTTR